MALIDIIQAIKAQADRDIAVLQETALREKNALQKESDAEIATAEEEAKKQTEAKKNQLMKKATAMVEMERKKVLLQEKRRAIDSVYTKALEEIQKLPADKKKTLTDKLMQRVKEQKGDVQEVKEGGFMFISDTTEKNYTFPHLVQNTLRPETELEVSAKLFA